MTPKKSKSTDQGVPFPSLQGDPEALPYLTSLCVLGEMLMGSKESSLVKKSGAFFHFLGTAPQVFEPAYFRIYTKMQGICSENIDYYSHYIFPAGNEYMLEKINEEIGGMGQFFNSFQIAMFGISERAKSDSKWDPLNILLWGYYSSCYEQRRLVKFLDRFGKALEEARDENESLSQSSLN
jgi:hypothetical protein